MKNKSIWGKTLPAIVVIMLAVVFFVSFMVSNNKRVVRQNGNYVSDAVDQTASHISDDLSTAVRTLGNISKITAIDEEDSDCYPESLKYIDNAIFSMIDYVAIDSDKTVREGGNTYYYGTLYGYRQVKPPAEPDAVTLVTNYPADSDGVEAYGQIYRYAASFALGASLDDGQASLREEFSSLSGTDSNMMSFFTPKYDSNGNILGVFIGRYDETKMQEILQATFFGEASGVVLCNADGEIITTTDDSLEESMQEGGTNIIDILQSLDASKSGEEIKGSFLNGEKLSFTFTTSKGTVNACFKQLPLDEGINADNWIIMQTFPATVTSQMQRLANLEGLQLGLELVFALALYIGIIILLNYRQNRKLVKQNTEMQYVVDSLSSLYDRFVYVNLNDGRYRYVADTYPEGCEIPSEGDYEVFKDAVIANVKDAYDRQDFTEKLKIDRIKSDLGGGTSELRYEYRTGKDGIKWEDLSLICLSREGGVPKEILFARQNISEFKEQELHSQVVLKEAIRAAEDANRAKSDFLSGMSHDIRTPMNAVLGFSALLENSADDPGKVKEYSKKIQGAGNHLLGLINEILDMSKIESGKFTIRVSEFKMSELLDEVNSVIMQQASLKNQQYSVNINLNGDGYLGDKLRISQILINLLSNAVKYTPEGGTIVFGASSGDMFSDNISNLVFTVKDDGIGMSEEFLTRLYLPFEREENTMTGKTQGTGLGMAITKNLIDLMGGIIDVQSKQGVGTAFTVTLPLRVADGGKISTPVTKSPEGDNPLNGLHFLIAEDNAINAEILVELLEISGAKCEVAENGREAVDKFKNSRVGEYDMILMDVQMPEMDGYAAARAIRSCGHPSAETIPIAAMTANSFADDVNRALESGMNAHMAKPVSLEVLKDTVRQLTNKR